MLRILEGNYNSDNRIIAGCGRFFEGTPEEMNTALNKTLASVPDDTVVYVWPSFLVVGKRLADERSLVMSIQKRTLNLPYRCCKVNQLKSSNPLLKTTRKRRANSQLETRK
jgi:hypothetical protein